MPGASPPVIGGTVPVYLKVPPEQIVFLKFLIESYEDLAVMRTLNPDRGAVVLLALPETVGILMELLADLKNQLPWECLEIPEGADEAWLLGEERGLPPEG